MPLSGGGGGGQDGVAAGIDGDGGAGAGSGNEVGVGAAEGGGDGQRGGVEAGDGGLEGDGNEAVGGGVGIDLADRRAQREVGAGDLEAIEGGGGVSDAEVDGDGLGEGGGVGGGREVEPGGDLTDASARGYGGLGIGDEEIALVVGRDAHVGRVVEDGLRGRAAVVDGVGLGGAGGSNGRGHDTTAGEGVEVAREQTKVAGGVIDEPDGILAAVGDVEIALGVETNLAGADADGGGGNRGRGAVAGVGGVGCSGGKRSGETSDEVNVSLDRVGDAEEAGALAAINGHYNVVGLLRDEDVAVEVDLGVFGSVKQFLPDGHAADDGVRGGGIGLDGGDGGADVAGVDGLSGAGGPVGCDLAEEVVAGIGNVDDAGVGIDADAARAVDLG